MTNRIDFRTDGKAQDWEVVTDQVMGGLSSSEVGYTPDSLLFRGQLSLENNGGFASVRSPLRNYDCSTYTGIRLRYRSVGKAFYVKISTSPSRHDPNYKCLAPYTDGSWALAELNFSDFTQYTGTRETGHGLSSVVATHILRFGVIVLEKTEGPFEIELDYIEFY